MGTSSTGGLAGRALIVGAGFAGLSAAAALAPFFDRVSVFEKDVLPPGPKSRRGVGHDQQLHILLKGGELSLEALMPGIRGDFLAAGACEVGQGVDVLQYERGHVLPRRDLGSSHLGMSRPAYEHVVRRQIRRLANVTIDEDTTVDALVLENDVATGLRVNGPGGERTESGDLVVVASGRGGQLPRQLADSGLGTVPSSEIGIEVHYATARFAKPPRFRGESAMVMCLPMPPDVGIGVICPIENDEWLVVLGGRFGRKPPTDLDGYRAYAATLAAPDIAERLSEATPLEPIRPYRVASASWWHYDRYPALPDRLIPIGDAITSFNPTFGQGMSVAAGHAVALRAALARRQADGGGLGRLAGDFFPHAMGLSLQAWSLAAAIDLEYPQTAGRRPPDYDKLLGWMEATRRAAVRHEDVQRLRFEITHMIKPPSALREGPLAALVAAELPRPA